MNRLPAISGEKAIKCFEKLDYTVVRQKGSHIRMWHKIDKSKKPLTIPKHKVLGKGLLRKLLRDAEIGVDEFVELL
ncbi:MAG: type II toxin-antitoxin system HicA family toxin [Methanosarcinales archaeon Met12]|nr:MAG: type II toxin-antitoxin system HicA family toxin [Methanosarcinales archaeon Met12]